LRLRKFALATYRVFFASVASASLTTPACVSL
jgi:hypothetical protein